MLRTTDASRDLLFGLLALQNGLIDQGALFAAFAVWTRDKSRPLADHLATRGDLDADDRAAVEALVTRHLKKHGGDAKQSLAAIPAGRSTRESLARIDDLDIEASLAHIGAHSTEQDHDPDRTASYSVGAATSDGQRFRVLRPHARGGLGAVFVALDTELHREVALKQILDKHADDAVSRQRFVLEAEVTGGLEHPGIVPVYGLGTYNDGRPYYAMRFIRGDSLKEAIDRFHATEMVKPDSLRRSLELRQLLRRFLDVCNAIEYAHSRGVPHRDIKPSNIVVGKHGETLVVDWGLAKARGRSEAAEASDERPLVPSSASGTAETLPGSALGTPAYMSPEQAQGDLERQGPHSDVYSLGATLYCLLTGKPPVESDDVGALLRSVQKGEFPPPRQLDPTIDRSLEAVCLKAMALNPGDRYATPKALADDIERWMADEPVMARREPTLTRVARWARRHRPLVTGAAALLITAVVGLTAGTILLGRANANTESQRRIAEANFRQAQENLHQAQDNFRQARQAVDEYFTKVSESTLLNVPGLRPLRRSLLESALRFYEEFLRRGGDEPSLLADFAATRAQVGQILADLSEQDKARDALRQTVELYDKALVLRQADVFLLERQAEVWHRLGDLDYRTDRALANVAYGKAIAIRERLAAEHPAEPRFRMALSRSFNGLAITTDSEEMMYDAYRRSLELRMKLAGETPDDPDLLHGLSESFINLSTILAKKEHRVQALELSKRSIEYGRAGLARRPHDLEFAQDLAASYAETATHLWQLDRRDEALVIAAEHVTYARKLAKDNPEVRSYGDMLANALGSHGMYLRELSRTEEAVASLRAAAEGLETKPDPDIGAVVRASIYRAQAAGSLAGDSAVKDINTWPEAARREADLAIADLRDAVARGYRRADIFRENPSMKSLLTRHDVKALLVEMEQPAAGPPPPQAKTTAPAPASTPLSRPGQLEEDRLLGEVAVGLLVSDQGKPGEMLARLQAILGQIEAKRKSAPGSPALESSARSIRVQIGKLLDAAFPTDPFAR